MKNKKLEYINEYIDNRIKKILKEQYEEESKLDEEKWMAKAAEHKGKLKHKLGLKDDETLSLSRIESELAELHKKYPEGNMSAEDLKLSKELVAARTMMKSHKK